MKKVIISIGLWFGILSSAVYADNIPYNVSQEELNYQFNFKSNTCVYRDLEARQVYISTIKDKQWWIDEKPVILEDNTRVIFIETYSSGNRITLLFAANKENCEKALKVMLEIKEGKD